MKAERVGYLVDLTLAPLAVLDNSGTIVFNTSMYCSVPTVVVGSKMMPLILFDLISSSASWMVRALEIIKLALIAAVPNLAIYASDCWDDGTLIRILSSEYILANFSGS